MPGKILGIDINQDNITAVQLTGGLKGYYITACLRIMIKRDGGLDDALGELSQRMELKSDTYMASVPPGMVSFRNIRLPFREHKKIRQALPFEIETFVPFPIDDLITDFIILDRSDQSEVLAVSAKKTYIFQYVAGLQKYGIDPDILDVGPAPVASWLFEQDGTPENGLLLDVGLNSNSMVLFIKKKIVLIRDFPFHDKGDSSSIQGYDSTPDGVTDERIESGLRSLCVSVQNTIHSFGWQTGRRITLDKIYITGTGALYSVTEKSLNRFWGIPVEKLPLNRDKRIRLDKRVAGDWNPEIMGGALALALRDPKKGHGFNLRKDDLKITRRYLGPTNEIRKAAAFLIVFLLFFAFDVGADYMFLKKRYEMADRRCDEVFRQTFPEMKNVIYPVLQMRQKIEEIEGSAVLLPGLIKRDQKILDLLMEISRRIPKSSDIDINTMVIDPETVRITGETDTFNTVDNVKNNLEPSQYFSSVTINSANLDRTGKKVNFEIKMQRAK